MHLVKRSSGEVHMILKHSIIISAFFCCGKTYMHQHPELSKYSMIEIEESIAGTPKNVYIKTYIDKLKDSIGKYDVILVTMQGFVLDFLNRNSLQYCYVYPEINKKCFAEWGRRNMQRSDAYKWGLRSLFIRDSLLSIKRDSHVKHHFILKSDQYLSDILENIIYTMTQDDPPDK